jgi:hypothetical protein
MKVFLSYASEDRAAAEEISLALAGVGHEVFFDRTSLPAGGDYHARIRAGIAEADALVFLIGPPSVAAGSYALTELQFARERWPHAKGRVLPVLLAKVDWASMPAYLKSVTVLEPVGNAAAEVVAALERLAPVRPARRWLLAGLAVLLAAVGIAWTLRPSAGSSSKPSSTSAEGVSAAPNGDTLLRRLEAVHIGTSVSRPVMVSWLDNPNRRYERLAQASLDALDGRVLKGPVELDVVAGFYIQALGLQDDNQLPVNPTIDPARLRRALVQAFNERNGTTFRSLDEIVQPR